MNDQESADGSYQLAMNLTNWPTPKERLTRPHQLEAMPQPHQDSQQHEPQPAAAISIPPAGDTMRPEDSVQNESPLSMPSTADVDGLMAELLTSRWIDELPIA